MSNDNSSDIALVLTFTPFMNKCVWQQSTFDNGKCMIRWTIVGIQTEMLFRDLNNRVLSPEAFRVRLLYKTYDVETAHCVDRIGKQIVVLTLFTDRPVLTTDDMNTVILMYNHTYNHKPWVTPVLVVKTLHMLENKKHGIERYQNDIIVHALDEGYIDEEYVDQSLNDNNDKINKITITIKEN